MVCCSTPAGLIWGLCASKVDASLKREADANSSLKQEADANSSPQAESTDAGMEVSQTEQMIGPPTFTQLSTTYWVFVLCGALMYGSIVPIWFIGSKIFQEEWGLSVTESDRLLLLPEGFIVLVAPALGALVDKLSMGLGSRLSFLGVGQACIGISYLTLALSHLNPVIPMIFLGFSYAICSTMYWASFPLVCPQQLLPLGTGILGTAVNILPSVLPPVLANMETYSLKLGTLAFLGLLSAGSAAVTALLVRIKSSSESGLYQRLPLASSIVIAEEEGKVEQENIMNSML
ncbi:hypothetical protein CYMTET_17083 [Cymbomonas tetramitiformis]|uniref:Lysosomal dipeptide transporter MFSD1 n=1 Tax=Cymbomonas tetramitiformis TaxID=36881 RepID=A0AAE0GAU6_9CHLO|nr:hypothetical protein CYMTET_17083 [Cymbomonas tetramitiformis]